MKQKKNDMVDRAEIIDDPSKKYAEIVKINDEMGDFLSIETNLSTVLSRIEAELHKETSHDQHILKSDTVDCIKIYFNKIFSEFKILSQLSSTVREKLYHHILNTSTLFLEFIQKMRSNSYSIHGIKYLLWLITNIESNIVLSGLKYLKWRVKLYVELCFLYEDIKSYKSAYKVITIAVNKINDLKAIEEQQGPLPDHIKNSFTENFRLLKNFEFKYGIYSGAFALDIWKKKLDETFTEEKLHKYICAINSISNLTCFNSIVNHEGLKISWKQQATSYVYEMVKNDLLNIKTGIVEYIDMKKRYVEISKKMSDERNYDTLLQETIQQNSQMNKAWKVSMKNIPIEVHIELLKATYDCQMYKEFIELIECLNVRLKYRNVEMPFLSEVDIQMSSIQYANIPNKYEKIAIDLNVNNYKKEIKRLREEGKYVSIKPGEKPPVAQGGAQKKNEKDAKGNAAASKKKPLEDMADSVPNPYEKIEGIEHSFIYLLLKKSHNPKNAITNIRIVMSNDMKIKNELKDNERAIAIPIRTFKDNLYEANEVVSDDFTSNLLNLHSKLIPYLVIRKNKTGLENEGEKLAAITDLYPLVSNSPYAEPPMNYKKIDPELSLPGRANDPNYIKYNFNHNFINLCFKTDDSYYIIEREVEVLRNLYELENSYSESNIETKAYRFLGLYYSYEKLDLLSTWLYNSIQGQIGAFFINHRGNILYDITILLWKKYLKNFLFRIDYFFKVETELEEEQRNDIMEKIISLQNQIFNSLYCIHHVMTQLNNKDPIIYAYLTSRLSDFSERTSNESTGVLILRDTLDYIEEVKERENIFGMNNEENKHSFTSFTCDNNKIHELTKEINAKFSDHVKELTLKRRQNYKQMTSDEPKKISLDEVREEDFEINQIEHEYEQRLKEKGIKIYTGMNDDNDTDAKKDRSKVNYYLTENENTLNCVYIDLQMKFNRLYIKSGDAILDRYDFSELKSTFKNHKPGSSKDFNPDSSTLSGPKQRLPVQTLNKLNIIKGDTAQYVKSNMEFLKHSLQDAGKLDPDKPILSKSERYMQMTISKNCYLNALYQASLALMRPKNKQDQIFLLRLSCNHIEKCFNEEDSRVQYYKDNFFYVKAMERYNKNTSINTASYYPYSLLYKPIMIDPVGKIPEPIMINKTAKTCTLIFPVIKIKNNQLDKYYRNVPKVSLYGQMSTGSNCVQLNNKNLNGTGEIMPIMNYVTVKDLKPNEKFIFAYAGYDIEDTIINQIGSTSKEVELYWPLPKFYLSYQVCRICYEYKHYALCKERSKIVFSAFTERTELKDKEMDSKLNTCLFYKLKYDYIARTSLVELEGIAFCFFFFAKSMIYLKKNDHSLETGVNIYQKQKNILKNINVLSLGLEIAIYIRLYQLIRMFACEIYSMSLPFINAKNLYRELLPIYMKISLGINIIPADLWERSLRKISSLTTYTIVALANSINESDLIKKALVNELGVNRKKYYPFRYKYMQRLDEDPKKKQKNPKEKTPKTPKDITMKQGTPGSQNPDEEIKYKEIEETSLKDIERECIELDEYILSTGDFNDIMRNRILQYYNLLDNLNGSLGGKYPEIQVEIDGKKKELSELIEVWDGFKAEGIKFLQKYIQTSKDKDKFYEYASKMIKKLIENFIAGVSSLNLTSYSLSLVGDKKGGAAGGAKDKDNPLANFPDILKTCDDIVIKEIDIGFVQNIFNQKVQFLTQDILYKMKVRIHDYLDIIQKEMPHDQTTQDIDLEKMGQQIEEKFFGCVVENEILPPYDTLSENDIYSIKEKLYWIGDLLFNKALVLYSDFLSNTPTNHQPLLNYDFNNFFNYKLCDLKKITDHQAAIANEDNNLKMLELRSGMFIKKEKPIVEAVPEETVKDPKAKKPDPKAKKPDPKADLLQNAPIDPFDNHIERQFDQRHQKLTVIFEKLALSALCLSNVGNYKAIDNLLSFTYNIILYDMLTPFDCVKENFWCYLSIIAEVAILRLKKLRNGEITYNEFNYTSELLKLKKRISQSPFNAKPASFPTLSKTSDEHFNKIDEEKLLEEYDRIINLDVYIEYLSFTIQCVYNMKKWSILSNLIENFNLATNEQFNEFTLTFLIEGQKNIYEKAHLNTTNKQTEINHRIEAYENWKNSRKKNKRQQLITGEIPPEQIEFDRDYSILSKELHIFKSISDLLRTDKEKSEGIYKSFVNDSNNALKAVSTCRKKYEDYQVELMAMKKYGYNYSVNFKEYQSKSKGITILTTNMIGAYKSCIQILKKRQENYLLIQILYEMSLVMYSIKDLKNAEVYFNEALDTVFQKLYSIKDFRNIFTIGPNATEKYGMRSLCFAICILHKMNKYCYDNDLYNQRECALMAAEITYNILNNSIPTPQNIMKFGLYRLSSINRNISVFKTSENVKPSDLLISLIEQCDTLIAYGDYEMCLPMLCLCDYLACDICKNINFTLRARVLKVICYAELGFVSEAMMVYYQIIKKLDIPTHIPYGYKENYIGKYSSLTKEFQYQNDLTPDNQKNVDAVNAFMKLSIDNDLKIMLGGNLFSELIFARLSLLFKIYQRDNYSIYPDKSPFIDQRNEMFMRIDKESRDNILLLNYYEELCYLNNMLKEIKFYGKEQSYTDQVKAKIEDTLNKSRLTNEEMNNYITVKFNKKDIDLSRERIELMFKYRILLSRMYACQGLSLTSSGILLKGLDIFLKLSTGIKFSIDLGDDFTFDFKPSEGKDAKGGKNPPPAQKKDVKKEPANAKDKNAQQVPITNPDEEFNKVLGDMTKYHPGRVIPNSIYWFKLHYLHLVNCFKMNRYTDCLKIIDQFKSNSTKVNDVFYSIRFKEIETMIYIQQYDIAKCEQSLEAIIEKGKGYFINDSDICYFYANYAEYLFISQNYELALQMLKTARTIIWEKMAKMNYIIPSQSKFNERLLDGLHIDKGLLNKLKDRESLYAAGGPGGAKKPPTDQKGAAKGQNEIEQIDYSEAVATEDNFDKPKIEFTQGENLYFKYTDLLCKIDLKYVLFQCMSIQPLVNEKIANSILGDLEIITKKQLYPHTIYNIMIYFLYGMLEKIKFIDDLRVFLKEKFYANLKLLKKNNLEVLTMNKEILHKFSAYYNESCVNKWIPCLTKAKDRFEQAFQIAKTDFLQFENSFSILNIISELADVNLLLAEYQQNSKMKYCDVMQAINKINSLIKTQQYYDKENDDLPYLPEDNVTDEVKEEKANFIKEKTNKEKLSHSTYLRNYMFYCELFIKVSGIKKSLFENTFELASNANLVDASKLPKDIMLQIIECDYITKKRNKDFTQNIIVKPSVDTFDVFNLMKNYMKEVEYFTFNQDVNIDESIKNLTKLHKFLKGNSANYSTKCYIEFILPPILTDPNTELAKPDQIIISYITSQYETINHKSVEVVSNAKDKMINIVMLLGKNSIGDDYKELVYGRVMVSQRFLLGMNQKIYNMKIAVRQSMTYSEEKKLRDLKYFQIDYLALIYDILIELLKGKKMFNEMKNIKEYFKECDIGDVSVEALDFWFNFLNFTTYMTVNQKFNALLNKVHLLLFK